MPAAIDTYVFCIKDKFLLSYLYLIKFVKLVFKPSLADAYIIYLNNAESIPA